MRLAVLDAGHDPPTVLTLRLMARLTQSDPPEIVSLGCYRHRFFGTPFFDLVQELMRGRSSWTVSERELFAAYVSKTNECPFCTAGHRAIAV